MELRKPFPGINVLPDRRLAMRIMMLFFAAVVALPVFAESIETGGLQHAVVDTVVANFGGVGHDETNGLEPSNIVIADATLGGNADFMAEEVASKFHGRVIADELIKSYRENERQSERVTTDDRYPIKVVRLDSFIRADGSYDWDEFNSRYPQVKAIVRVSKPALDSLATVAIVRCEVVTRKGFAWGVFAEIERQTDGSWLHTRAVVGDIRVVEPSPTRTTSPYTNGT